MSKEKLESEEAAKVAAEMTLRGLRAVFSVANSVPLLSS